jgi:hypothetical protein
MSWSLSLDDLRAWSQDADPAVRRWAVDRWMALYPTRDIEQLAVHLMDDDLELQRDVALFLAGTGDAKWFAVLAKGHEVTKGRSRTTMVEALGLLGHSAAVPLLQASLRSARQGLDLVAAIHALGRFRVEGAWAALAPLVDLLQADDVMSATLFRLLLGMGRRGDVPRLLERWREWQLPEPSQVQRAWASWLGVSEDELAEVGALSPGEALPDLALDGDAKAQIRQMHRHVAELLHGRSDDLQGWLSEQVGTPSEDYRALALGAEALLATMAAVPPREERAAVELALATLAVRSVARRQDEARALATDPGLLAPLVHAAGTLPIAAKLQLTEDPAAHEAAVLDLLDNGTPTLVAAVAEVVAKHPLASLAPALAAALRRTESSAVADKLVAALRAIGPESVDALMPHLPGSPATIVRALGELPTEASIEVLAGRAVLHTHVDLVVAEALTNTGHPRALEALAPAWRPGMVPLSAMLTALATLHDSPHPDRTRWLHDLQRADGARAVAMSGAMPES